MTYSISPPCRDDPGPRGREKRTQFDENGLNSTVRFGLQHAAEETGDLINFTQNTVIGWFKW
jgi:hypothetical protein